MEQIKGFMIRRLRRLTRVALLCLASSTLWAQATPALTADAPLREQLVNQPLYLRGFWMGYNLDFDPAGQPLGKPGDRPLPGPLTLSGIEVKDVSIKGSKLILHAERVALVANADGVLERRSLLSTTHMFGTMQKEYRSKDMVKITILAAPNGSFDAPLHALFANGLADLAPSVPPAWRCYAKAYFAADPAAKSPASSLAACVEQTIYTSSRPETPPTLVTQPQAHGTREAAELKVSGESEVSIRIDAQGTPINFQIVRPLGAGLDEDLLGALSRCRFAPATRGGLPVQAGLDFSMQYQ